MLEPRDPVTEHDDQEFREAWRGRLLERYGTEAVPDADRLALVEHLIAEAAQGAVPHRGRWYQIAPDGLDPTTPAAIAAATTRARQAPLGPLLALCLGVPLVLGALFYALLFSGPHVRGAAVPATAAPTVVGAAATAPPAPASPTVPADASAAPGDPLELTLAGRPFRVRPSAVTGGTWAVDPTPGLANWLAGATSNWSFFLVVDPADPATRAWLAGLALESPARLTLAAAPVRNFRLVRRTTIGRDAVAALDPHQAGLTIGIRPTSGPADTLLLLQGQERAPDTKGGGAD